MAVLVADLAKQDQTRVQNVLYHLYAAERELTLLGLPVTASDVRSTREGLTHLQLTRQERAEDVE